MQYFEINQAEVLLLDTSKPRDDSITAYSYVVLPQPGEDPERQHE